MKRRHFIRGIGLGSAAVATSLPLAAGIRVRKAEPGRIKSYFQDRILKSKKLA